MSTLSSPTLAPGADRAGFVAESELQRSLARLRFALPLEAAFRADYEMDSTRSRLLLLVLAIVAVALTPLYDLLFLKPPAGFVPVSRWLQFGLELPALMLTALTFLPQLRRWQPAALIVTAWCVGGGLCAQRMIGAQHDYVVPFDFAAVTIASIYIMGRLRFWLYFPWALAMMLAASAAEIFTFGADSEALYNCLALLILVSMLSVGAHVLERGARENWYRRRQLSMLALHDPLTGLANRRHFDDTLVQLVRAAARTRGTVALMVIDIDEFKAYNDRYGHPAGDACLTRIGEWLASCMRRPHDFCARIGGEEFVAIWSDAKPADALRLAENLRQGITALGIAHEALGEGQVVTASAGFIDVVAPEPEAAARSIAKLLMRRADERLYRAKHAGRDRLVSQDG